jgi:hypothetical protein
MLVIHSPEVTNNARLGCTSNINQYLCIPRTPIRAPRTRRVPYVHYGPLFDITHNGRSRSFRSLLIDLWTFFALCCYRLRGSLVRPCVPPPRLHASVRSTPARRRPRAPKLRGICLAREGPGRAPEDLVLGAMGDLNTRV